MITDFEGTIVNVSEGLRFDMGLFSKFFNYLDSIFMKSYNLRLLCEDLDEILTHPDISREGVYCDFDTTNLLTSIDYESLS